MKITLDLTPEEASLVAMTLSHRAAAYDEAAKDSLKAAQFGPKATKQWRQHAATLRRLEAQIRPHA
jgi:hypothetical protein